MTSRAFNPADELARLISEGQLSERALRAITGVESRALSSFLGTIPSIDPGAPAVRTSLSGDESARLSALAAQLTEGFRIDDDNRVRGIIESLTSQCQLSLANIALLTRIDQRELERFLANPSSIDVARKYQLSTRVSYLLNAVTNAAALPSWP